MGIGAWDHIYMVKTSPVWFTPPMLPDNAMIETGVVNVLGSFNITVGLSYSIGFDYPYLRESILL